MMTLWKDSPPWHGADSLPTLSVVRGRFCVQQAGTRLWTHTGWDPTSVMQPAASFRAGGRAPGCWGVLGSGFPYCSSSHRLSCETPDGSESSWITITDSEVGSSSRASSRASLSPSREDAQSSILTSTASSSAEVPLSPSREDPHSCIMTNEANSSTELCLSPLSEESWTSTTASNLGSFSLASALTPVDEGDMAHASSVHPGLGHPRTNLEEQPGPETFPSCEEVLAICLEASSVQQQQQDLQILTAAPTPPPEVPEVCSKEMEMPLTCHKDLDTLESLILESKLEQELGLSANVDDTPKTVPASAAPKRQRPKKQEVMVLPIVQDLFFLKKDMKSRLERHIYKMNVQRHYGLQKKILECEESFEKFILR
ncbi:uncharacterized protein LOC135579228 [Columba livia]|uniref:uncharacterized protein LOC135579228 n=1 Tax=Columba livia TaxID=8932 RepID=UPI0031BA0613